jgi:hypothetical protein
MDIILISIKYVDIIMLSTQTLQLEIVGMGELIK